MFFSCTSMVLYSSMCKLEEREIAREREKDREKEKKDDRIEE